MKKLTVIYIVMFILTFAIPAAVCFINKSNDSNTMVDILHPAAALIEGLIRVK